MKKKPVVRQEDIDDVVGTKSSNQTAQAAIIEQGIYLNEHRNSIIVTGVRKGVAHTIRIDGTEIKFAKLSVSRLAADYHLALPNYPVRRAARIYLKSPIPKDTQSGRLLRALLQS